MNRFSPVVFLTIFLFTADSLGQVPNDLTKSTASISEDREHSCLLDMISYQPPAESIITCLRFGGSEYRTVFKVYCFPDTVGLKRYLEQQADDSLPPMFFTCPVRRPILFVDGEGVDLQCSILTDKEKSSFARSQILRGESPYRARTPDVKCQATKFSIPWEPFYEDSKVE